MSSKVTANSGSRGCYLTQPSKKGGAITPMTVERHHVSPTLWSLPTKRRLWQKVSHPVNLHTGCSSKTLRGKSKVFWSRQKMRMHNCSACPRMHLWHLRRTTMCGWGRMIQMWRNKRLRERATCRESIRMLNWASHRGQFRLTSLSMMLAVSKTPSVTSFGRIFGLPVRYIM